MLWANRRAAARELKAAARAVRKLPPTDAQVMFEVLLRSLATEVLTDDVMPVGQIAEKVAGLVKALKDHEAIVAALTRLGTDDDEEIVDGTAT
jgi:hypothetical protein